MRSTGCRATERTLFAELFAGIADEMLELLVRSAYSANIKERRDCSTAVFDRAGRLVAQAAAIPVHLGAMPLSVAAALEAFREWNEGDIVILNDPFRGGTHIPDITMVSPVFASGEGDGLPVFFLASRAHHADMGGAAPGSMPLAREIYEEGLRLPPVRIRSRGQPSRDVWEILLANVRTPSERRGDLRAQIASHAAGALRLGEAIGKNGTDLLRERIEDLLTYGELLMRSTIEGIPDGAYEFEDVLDGDGFGAARIPIRARVVIEGEDATIDFTGTAPACSGGVNAVVAITRSAVVYCFLCLLGTSKDPGEVLQTNPPLNEGCYRPIRIIIPGGTVISAGAPHAVAAGNVETSQRIVDVVLGALAQALPDRIPAASQGTMNNLALGGRDPRTGAPWAFYETVGGGTGAGPSWDGADAVHSHMTNTWNTPVEALEFAFPIRVERYEIRRGTGGAGTHRGGDGLRRDLRLLSEARGALLAERRETRPYGLEAGAPGCPGEDLIVRDGLETRLPPKVSLNLRPGDIISVRSPGGGGWGPPAG